MTPHDLLANFETLAEAPKGIQRLRELVLELAVRGKLVEQDPKDELAIDLMKRIQKEHANLARIAGFGKPKGNGLIPSKDWPFAVPESWSWVDLATLGWTQTGTTPKISAVPNETQLIPFVRPNDISWAGVDSRREFVPRSVAASEGRIAPAGSVLMVCIGTIGKTGPCWDEVTFNQQINSITPVLIDPNWLGWVLRAPYFQFLADANSSSTTLRILNKGKWEKMPVPLAPLPEQRRIVARVDELMALLDRLEAKRQEREAARTAARDSALAALREAPTPEDVETSWLRIQERFHELFATPEDVEPLRALVLEMAVRGKLVEQDSREGRAHSQFPNLCKGKQDGDAPKRGRQLKGPDAPEPAPEDLPNNAIWVPIGNLMDLYNGRAFKPNEWATTGLPIIRIQNLNDPSAPFNFCNFEVPEKVHVHDGDLLISWSGTPGTSFGAFIWNRGHAVLNQHIFRVELRHPHLVPDYIRLSINARLDEMISRAHGGVGLRHITKGELEAIGIPIPPEAEQRRIVARVDELMALLDRLSQALETHSNLAAKFAAAAVHHLEA